jgi:twinkle protein
VTCPRCSSTRKKSRDKCLSVNTGDGTWCCHHCSWSGRLGGNVNNYGTRVLSRVATPAPPRSFAIPKPPPADPLPEKIVAYFAHRGIPESVLLGAGITAGSEWCPQLEQASLAIRFPYVRDGQLVNIKYRTLDKHFWMVKGAQRILYGLDDITEAEIICVVEGEMDKLSIDTAGGPPTVSVPDGAPAVDAKHYASKFTYLDGVAKEQLNVASLVLIATDMDAPGQKLADELARRIGCAKCRRASWHPWKDANELLVRRGPQAVLEVLANAHPWPIVDGHRDPRARPSVPVPPIRGRRPIVTLPGTEVWHGR